MTTQERRTLRGFAAVLLTASLARLAWDTRTLPPVLPPDSARILPALLAASESLLVEEELRGRRLLPGETIDPNGATEVDWDRLPGVGAVTAARIVETRDRLGGFATLEQITEVPGIGERTLEEIRPYLEAPARGMGGAGVGAASTAVGPDLNRASEAELQSLPGIGPALASRIVESRSAEGPFRSIEELARVRGIGPSLVERLRGRVTVGHRPP